MKNAPQDNSDAYRLLWHVEIGGYLLNEDPKKHNRLNLTYGGPTSTCVEAYVDITRIETPGSGIELFDSQCLGTALCPRFSRDFGLFGNSLLVPE